MRSFKDTTVGTLLCRIENAYGRVQILLDSELEGSSTGGVHFRSDGVFYGGLNFRNSFALFGTTR